MSASKTTPNELLIQAAIAELATNTDKYKALLTSIKAKNPAGITDATIVAALEAVKDYRAVAPVLATTIGNVKAGVTTTEFKMASRTSQFLMFVTMVAPIVDGIVAYTQNTSFGNSIWISGLAMFSKALVTMNYTTSRAKIKVG